MTLFHKRIFLARPASIYAVLLVNVAFAASVHAADYVKSFSISNRAKVHVDTNDGNVQIVTGDTKEVEFRVEYTGLAIDKTLHIDSRQQGDDVEITARVVGRTPFSVRALAKLRVVVRMPKDGDLRAESGDGSITVDGLSGAVDLRSGDGKLSVKSLTGEVRLHSGDGSIDGIDLDGKCDVVSGDGHIRVTGRFDVLRARSGDGRIDVAALHGSKLESNWDIGSGDGRIDLALPTELAAFIDANSRDGQISTSIPLAVQGIIGKSQLRGNMNGGGKTMSIHSGDGAIRLKQV